MPNTSLRAQLKKIGEPNPSQAIPALPGGFHSMPQSLKAAMHAMNPPLIENWFMSNVSSFENLTWTEECQGLTSDGQSWFIVSNNEDNRAIHKFASNFTHLGKANLPQARHIGDPSHHAGKIFVPVEGGMATVWVLDTNLNTLGITPLGGASGPSPQGGSMPWCAVNPWNGYLYSSSFDNVDRIYAYDPSHNFTYMGDLRLQGGIVNRVQGGCFSNHGHLYLTSDSTKEIRAYSALNGAFLGSHVVPYEKGGVDQEEMEGITILHWFAGGGISTHVHVVILDNDATNKDDVFLKHFTVPDPDVL